MRPLVVLPLFLALTILATSGPVAASQDVSSSAYGCAQKTASTRAEAPGRGRAPADSPWPLVLTVGYISMALKKQLRRRGYPGAERTETFADLISLRRRPLRLADENDQPPGPKPPTAP